MWRKLAMCGMALLAVAGCSADPAEPAAEKVTTAVQEPVTTVRTPPAADQRQPYCKGVSPCVPDSIRRPLRVPKLTAGTPCPVSRVVAHSTGVPIGKGAGRGPVYAGPYAPPSAFAVALPPTRDQLDFAGSAWGGEKVLWHAAPAYRGPVLIRGRRLDGEEIVRFQGGVDPLDELSFPALPGTGWREWPTYTRVIAAGCYAWQVDGIDFTDLIVFKVVRATATPGYWPPGQR
jgi:hypothetical protein